MTSTLVAGFGSVVADVLMLADAVSLGHKNHVAHQEIQVGGVVPTALIVLSRLGIATQLHTAIGDDLFGDALLAIFKKENVGLGTIVRGEKTETPLAFVVIQKKTGHRTSFYTTGAFPTISRESFVSALDPKTTHLLIDGHNSAVALDFIRAARKQEAQILLDLGNPKDGMDQLIKESHVVIAPQAYWKTVWPGTKPEAIIQHLLSTGPELVVLTMEEYGSSLKQRGVAFSSVFVYCRRSRYERRWRCILRRLYVRDFTKLAHAKNCGVCLCRCSAKLYENRQGSKNSPFRN